jgi:crotonobetainyl-CoA:carnitine CoA-transferase CaiB-like acyl-CoA transferase
MPTTNPVNDAAGVRFLEDVTVLEVANLAPTQLAMHLADLGANVIKIEPPKRGDATRLVGVQPGFADSSLHRRWNRGKKSVAIDMTTKEGVALFLRLIPTVDIVIEGLRPGSLQKMGVSWEQMVELNPDLVMVALSGWGQAGPYRTMGSHGIGFDAIAGLADVKRDESGHPRVLSRHVNMGTLLAPLFGATSVLAALNWSRRTGQPVFLDVAQANAAAFANFSIENAAAMRSAEAAGTAPPPAEPEGPAQSIPNGQAMQSYLTRDDQILLLMALERKFFVRLAEAVGRPDLLDHIPKDVYLVRGNPAIEQILSEVIATKNLSEWMAIFSAADVPVVPVYQGTEALDDIHMRDRLEWLPSVQGTVTMKSPVKAYPRSADPAPAPRIGQDTLEVLSRVGVTNSEAETLASQGVIRIDKDDA